MRAVVQVGRRRCERRGRVGGLLDEVDHAPVVGQVDDPVAGRQLARADVAHGDRAAHPVRAPRVDERLEAEVEQVVARDDEQVVVDPGLGDDEPQVADRAEPVVVRGRRVVVDGGRAGPALAPRLERRRLARVRHDVDLVDLVHLFDRVDDPVQDRPPADRQQLLRPGVGERAESGRVPGREDDRLHAVTAPASDST